MRRKATTAVGVARGFALLTISSVLVPSSPSMAIGTEELWAMLRSGGHVVMIRHASTDPGVGDPPRFRVDDCSTQRNLSAAGREEARRLGAAFRQRGITVGRVLSSQWCRCLETARLAFGAAEPWPALNSYFNDRSREAENTPKVRALVSERPTAGNLVLVTHQFNIGSVTGVYPAPGEMVILAPQGNGTFRVAGRLSPAAFAQN